MTKQHRLTPEQWETIALYADDNLYDACFLELRTRIEELEADALEQSRSQEFCLDHIIKRLEKLEIEALEAAQQPVSTPNKLPEPVAPTDEELLRLACMTDLVYDNGYGAFPSSFMEGTDTTREALSFARAVLARFGTPANTINQED